MLSIGKKITIPGDKLNEVSVEKIYKAIKNLNGDVALLQQRLQYVKLMDINQYRKLKTTLPYLVCAQFHPKIRKKENFLFTERFLIDIDHLSEYQLNLKEVKAQLSRDPRIELLFTSPGGDGLKVLFRLAEKITDSGYYAVFYKAFCHHFANQYQLGTAVDSKTNDVSRCCFVSFDPDAFYNSDAEKIIAGEYVAPDSFEDFDRLQKEFKMKEKEEKELQDELGLVIEKPTADLPDEILNEIKLKVGLKIKKPREKYYEQPEELGAVMQQIMEELASIDVTLTQSNPISYGRQIKVTAGNHWAELNIFYGQRGISIVGSTKSGSNKELRDMVTSLLKSYFD